MRTAPISNSARFVAKPLTHGGTPAPLWLAAFERGPLPALDLAECRRLIVVAPHPHDETLGLGAMIAQLIASGVDVRVVSVSDGGAAQPGTTRSGRIRLSTTRRYEIRRATGVLGAPPPVRLGLPDGELANHEDRVARALADILRSAGPGAWCAATWRGDGHPDYEAVGRAAAAACARTGVALLEYPVWMWHWASPADPAVPWGRARSVPAPGWAINRKRQAAQCYRSQLRPGRGETPPVLPPFVLQRLLTVGEVVFR
ncbi:LmbE family protein [Mycobacterium sp. 852002-53434_SCH5985345]|uniref:PIG-L deacetylase family protein n=1 Tax=unclassified Mycobacterium TaxID=2642494 RepID=UPI00080147F5|nr:MULTISPECIES: PIG-L family deacetylase [unclassified Mycobacterium]OBF60125.1 LmbE family protein [Mycobacterium sp. 852002-53434_SCH5985345]OBF70336.1 LmbE family protein [Mycobacterium sp. 852002-51613_SCH5001154]